MNGTEIQLIDICGRCAVAFIVVIVICWTLGSLEFGSLLLGSYLGPVNPLDPDDETGPE